MKASSTEVQNNFGKYLALAAEEEVIVTRNGVPVAKLAAVKEPEVVRWDAPYSLSESVGPHHFVGRKATFEVGSTEVQNNFGKFLMLASREDVMITRNGKVIAKLTAIQEPKDGDRKVDVPGNPMMVLESAKPYRYERRKASYEEFLELVRNSEERYEYIDGEIYLLASPRAPHQFSLRKLLVTFDQWSIGKRCEPWTAPFDIRLYRFADKPNLVQPDLMMICDFDDLLDEEGYYRGVPALIVEIISESTKRVDSVVKFDLYRSCGVKEYWIVDPSTKRITIYRFEDGEVAAQRMFAQGETAASYLFEGLSAAVDQVFR